MSPDLGVGSRFEQMVICDYCLSWLEAHQPSYVPDPYYPYVGRTSMTDSVFRLCVTFMGGPPCFPGVESTPELVEEVVLSDRLGHCGQKYIKAWGES